MTGRERHLFALCQSLVEEIETLTATLRRIEFFAGLGESYPDPEKMLQVCSQMQALARKRYGSREEE